MSIYDLCHTVKLLNGNDVQVIEESKNVLDGKYAELFHLESFETIITKERQEGESICKHIQ